MYAASGEGASQEPTAFRVAEKVYQLHKDTVIRFRNGKRRGKQVVRPTDLSQVVDVDAGPKGGDLFHRQPTPAALTPSAAVYSFARHPGLLLVRGALSPAQQWELAVDALTAFPQPPAHTNLTLAHGGLPGLWSAAQRGLRLTRHPVQPPQRQQQQEEEGVVAELAVRNGGGDDFPSRDGGREARQEPDGRGGACWAPDGVGPAAASLLRRLRWATLGPPYDWTRRTYRREERHAPLPRALRDLALTLASIAGEREAGAPPFDPDAALVNYYYEGDTLGGHQDDAELDLRQPIISLSLGCQAVFLMGGGTRDVAPTPLLLRGGDAVVLAGPARRCFHGVPRIFAGDDAGPGAAAGGESDGGEGEQSPGQGRAGEGTEEQLGPFVEHMRGCRINLSIRATT